MPTAYTHETRVRWENDHVWLALHNASVRKLRAAEAPADSRTGDYHGSIGEKAAVTARMIEQRQPHPRDELLAAARSGDVDAAWRADCLFVDWRLGRTGTSR